MSKIVDLTPPGSLASGYKTTLITVDRLLSLLNELQIEGCLPSKDHMLSERIDEVIYSALITIRLGQLNFPDMKFGDQK